MYYCFQCKTIYYKPQVWDDPDDEYGHYNHMIGICHSYYCKGNEVQIFRVVI